MVCWNSAEAEIDEEKGEIVLISRHKWEKGNKELSAKNYPKIYGAVSVLLVEQNNRSFDSEDAGIGIDTSNATELQSTGKSAEGLEKIQSHISNGFNKIAIPASLSLIPVPLFGLSKTNFAHDKVDVPKTPPLSSAIIEPRSTSLYKETCKPLNSDRSFNGNNENPPDCSIIVLDSTADESNALPNKSESSECFTALNQYHDPKGGHDENSPPLYRMQASMLGINDCQVASQSSNHRDNHHQQPQQQIKKIKPKSNKGHANSRSQSMTKTKQIYPNGDHDCHDTCLYCRVKITELDEIINHALTNHEVKPDELMVILCPLCKGTYSKHDLHEFMEHVKYHINSRKEKASTRKDSHTVSRLGTVTDSLHSNFTVNKFDPSRNVNRTSDPRKAQTGFSSQKMGGLRVRLSLKKDTANKPMRFQRRLVRISSANPKTCIHCDQRIISYRDIMRHNKMHGFVDMCPICSRTFGIRSGLLRHCMTHIQSRVYSCHYCSAIFTRSDNLSRHVSTVHMKSPRDTSTLVKAEDSNKTLYKMSDNSDDILNGQCLNKNPDDLTLKDMATVPNIDPWTAQETSAENDIQSSIVIDDRSPQAMLIDDECTGKNMTGVENLSPSPVTGHESERELSTLNYACSACKINFLTLDHLKQHVVFTHAEQVPNEENLQIGEHEEMEQINIPGSSKDSESNAGQNYVPIESSSSAGGLNGGQFRDSSSTAVRHIQIKQEFDESEVIDIENLSEFTEFHSKFSQDVKCEPEGDCNPEFFSNKDNVVDASIDRAPPETSSFMDSFLSVGGANSMTGFYGETHHDHSTTATNSSHFEINNSEMQQQISSGLFDSMISSSDMNGSSTDLDFSQQRDETSPLQSIHGSSSQSTPLNQKHLLTNNKATVSKRKRYLTSTLPICHFCEVYLHAENGGSILRHGDTHKDLFNSVNTCTICLAELSGRDSLHRHASSHVGTWFSCKYCDNAFSRKDNLKRHIKKAHPEILDT